MMDKIKEEYKKIQPDDGLKNDILKHVIESEPKPTRLFLIKRAVYVLTIIVGVFVVNNLANNHIDNTPAPNEQEDAQEVVVVPEDPGQTDTIKDKEPIYNETTEEMIRNEHPTASIIETNSYVAVEDMNIGLETGGFGINATHFPNIEEDLEPFPISDNITELPIFINQFYNPNLPLAPDYTISVEESINALQPYFDRFGIKVEDFDITEYGYSVTFETEIEGINVLFINHDNQIDISIDDAEKFIKMYNLEPYPAMNKTNVRTKEEAEQEVNWIKNVLGIEEDYKVTRHCYLEMTDLYSCDAQGSLLGQTDEEQLFNNLANKLSVKLVFNPNELMIIQNEEVYTNPQEKFELHITISKPIEYQLIGNYPIITAQQAKEKLLNQEYVSTNQIENIDEDLVFNQGLKYLDSDGNQYLVPVYVFRIDLQLEDMPDNYGYFYVPAVEGFQVHTSFN